MLRLETEFHFQVVRQNDLGNLVHSSAHLSSTVLEMNEDFDHI